MMIDANLLVGVQYGFAIGFFLGVALCLAIVILWAEDDQQGGR